MLGGVKGRALKSIVHVYSAGLLSDSLSIIIIIILFVDQMEMQLPFLITTLVGHNKQISGIVSSHVQWLEKLLADVEKALLAREASNKKSNHAQELKELKCIYILLKPWNTEFRYGYSCTLSIPCMMYMYM